eukprot:scpid106831/ scgid6769/ 
MKLTSPGVQLRLAHVVLLHHHNIIRNTSVTRIFHSATVVVIMFLLLHDCLHVTLYCAPRSLDIYHVSTASREVSLTPAWPYRKARTSSTLPECCYLYMYVG